MGHDVTFIYNEREDGSVTTKAIWKKRIKAYIKKIVPKKLYTKCKHWYKNKKGMPIETIDTSAYPLQPYILTLPNHPILAIIAMVWPGFEEWIRPTRRHLQWKKVLKFTFHDGNFHMKRMWTHRDYKRMNRQTDLYVTSSDQIWNPFCGGYNPMMFVEFGGDVRRIAYSSSISQPEIHPLVKDRMAKALSKFSFIAVREQKSVELLSELLHRDDIHLVVDPTYLLSAQEWDVFGKRAEMEFEVPEKYIFCYFVGHRDLFETMVDAAKKYTRINEVITLDCYNRPYVYGGGRLYNDAGPYEWVYLLEHASYVCMDSFHATAFSLKFHKDFVVALKNSTEGTGSQNGRMYDILSRYGLSNKLYRSAEDTAWQQPIDYAKVDPIIEKEIAESMAYLKKEIANE